MGLETGKSKTRAVFQVRGDVSLVCKRQFHMENSLKSECSKNQEKIQCVF